MTTYKTDANFIHKQPSIEHELSATDYAADQETFRHIS